LNKFVLDRPEHEASEIRNYVETQARPERVTHLEKVATEQLFDRRHDAWDVLTNKDRYWVITGPTNLYSQKDFPSVDYTMSFHIGLMMRVLARSKHVSRDEQEDLLAPAWRRLSQAGEALNKADEAEEFQSVGMRCREALLALVRGIARDSMVPQGATRPQSGNFIEWSDLIANAIASGSSAERIRGHLKSIAESTWHLVQWLTHSSNAVRFDGRMAVDATEATITAFGAAVTRLERGAPDRCPNCTSYRIASVYTPELEIDPPYVSFCEACGWRTAAETDPRT
jgi:hypothetical protein